jgi:UDP-glucose 4-epimerase
LMNDRQRAAFSGGRDAAVALRHPDGTAMRRHIVAVEDCVSAYLLALKTERIEGETFMIAMTDPFSYVEAAQYAARRLNIETLDLIDPVGKDFCIDTTKARYVLGYKPTHDIFSLIDKAVEFRRAGCTRRARSGFKG